MTLIEYLNFNRSSVRGIVALVSIVLAIAAANYFYPYIANKDVPYTPAEFAELDSLTQQKTSYKQQYTKYSNDNDDESYHRQPWKNNNFYEEKKLTLFYFYPNTIDAAGWQRIGIREKTIAGIQKYIAKGGRFRQASDIQKIWGLSQAQKDALEPYIKIDESKLPTYKKYYDSNYTYTKKTYPKYEIAIVDINTADSAAYEALPGIGPALSRRIVKYREKLGGFYSVQQIAETYGLPDSTFQKIKPYIRLENKGIKQININTATVDDFKKHPYFGWQLAKVVVNYRTQHGNFTAVEQLKNIMIIDAATYQKLAPYLTIQ
jgi:competence protein ComEA